MDMETRIRLGRRRKWVTEEMQTLRAVAMVMLRYGYTVQYIAEQAGVKRSNLSAFLAGRGHVGNRKRRKLYGWCRRLLNA